MATFAGVALILAAALLLYLGIQVNAVPSPATASAPLAAGVAAPPRPAAPARQPARDSSAPVSPVPAAPSITATQQAMDRVAPRSSAPTPARARTAPRRAATAPAAPGKTTPAGPAAPPHATHPAPPPPPLPRSGPVTKRVIWGALRAAGYSRIQAAGVMGNMRNESDFNVETNWPDTNGFHAYGLISWNARFYPRAPSLVTGHQRADLARQVQYLLHHTRRIRKGLRG